MAIFEYTAKDKSGKKYKGEIEAESESAVASILSSKDVFLIRAQEKRGSSFSFLNKISSKDKIQTIRQLASMINAGLPISKSIKVLEDQAKKKVLKKTLLQVYSDVEGGMQLSAAFSKLPDTFSELDIALIASGEASGSLNTSLLRLADQLEKQRSINNKIRGALIYPSVVLLVTITVTVLMLVVVVPQMQDLYRSFEVDLPFFTRILIGLSDFVSSYGLFALPFFAFFGVYFSFLLKTPKGKRFLDSLKINIWGVKIILIKLYMARLTRVLSGMISSGIPLVDSLEITSRSIGNVFYQEKIIEAAEDVRSGLALSVTMESKELFPGIVPQMIKVGEETGDIDGMLENMAIYFEEEVDDAVRNISSLIEPVVIVVLALIVLFMLLAILLPIYQVIRVI